MEIYKIDVYNKITGLNEPSSGYYQGNLNDILSRLSCSVKPIDSQITIKKIQIKSIDMNLPINEEKYELKFM